MNPLVPAPQNWHIAGIAPRCDMKALNAGIQWVVFDPTVAAGSSTTANHYAITGVELPGLRAFLAVVQRERLPVAASFAEALRPLTHDAPAVFLIHAAGVAAAPCVTDMSRA